MSEVRPVDQSPDEGVGFSSVLAGRHCHSLHLPTKVEWRGRSVDPAMIGDIARGESGVLHLSGRARLLIEELEPNVHQFVPFKMLKAGKPFDSRSWFIVGNRLDSVDCSRTTFVLRKGRVWRELSHLVRRGEQDLIPPGLDPKTPSRLVFSAEQIGKAKVWRDKHLEIGPLLSPDMAEALIRSGLTGHELFEVGQIA